MTFRRRDWGFIGLILLVAGATILLGIWQLNRHAERQLKNSLIAARMFSATQDMTGPELFSDEALYRRARVSGELDQANEILIKNRSYNGQPGYHLVTPLRLGPESGILINRGWIPMDPANAGARADYSIPGPTTIEGILLPSQQEPGMAFLADPTLSPGQPRLSEWRVLAVGRIQEQIPYPLSPHYLQQTEISGDPAPILLEEPEIDPGPHLGYAIQWFAFTLVALIGGFFWLRRRVQDQPAESEV